MTSPIDVIARVDKDDSLAGSGMSDTPNGSAVSPATAGAVAGSETGAGNDVDIAICGAGPAGMALAALLVRAGLAPHRLALVDARELEQAVADPRSIAVSHGSRELLEQIDAWPGGVTSQGETVATPIHEIHVSRRGHFGRTLMRDTDFGVPALGYVIRYGALVETLARAVEDAGIDARRGARVTGRFEEAGGVRLALGDGGTLRAGIVVMAEGGLFPGPGAATKAGAAAQSAQNPASSSPAPAR
jgi:2-octaprenyl-6-methoxyphenol hydroxylase